MGTRAEPFYIKPVVSAGGNSLEKYGPTTKLALDPRVTYLVDSVLKDVLNKGTGAQVRAKGFTLPAAGKTGTSRDGWFAGFTNNLVCVIWIGFDDNRDLGLAGGNGTRLGRLHDSRHRVPARDVRILTCRRASIPDIIDVDTLNFAPNCPVTAKRSTFQVPGRRNLRTPRRHNPLNAAGSFLSHIFGGGSSNLPACTTEILRTDKWIKTAPIAGTTRQPGR
jgi:membrane peptidoglycan carboxypeptidase